MVRGLYAAASGMIARMSEQDVLADNLANAGTPGFRRGSPVISSFPDALALAWRTSSSPAASPGAVPITGGAQLGYSIPDLSPGPMRETGNPLNIAIDGPGFFVALSDAGYIYTRAGNFTLNDSRVLVTANGEPVLGTGGIIRVPEGEQISCDRDGVISVDGQIVARLLICTPPDPPALLRAVGGLASSDQTLEPLPNPSVRQGYLEDSNVNAIKEMAAMIVAYRVYEANQRALQAQDQTLDKVINDVGRV